MYDGPMIRTSAPGSIMLFGEHAVLHGHPAVVAAVQRRVHVNLAPRRDRLVRISSALSTREVHLDHLAPSPPLAFVEQAIVEWRPRLPAGFELEILAEFSPTIGLGSSAAVTVAVVGALRIYAGMPCSLVEIARCSSEVIRKVQGVGSGADAWASTLGGIRLFRMEEGAVRTMEAEPPLLLVYSGRKTPTPLVVSRVEQLRQRVPEVMAAIFTAMGELAREGAVAIQAADWPRLGVAMNIAHDLMAAIGVDTPELRSIANVLRSDPGIFGAKISGSGLGDCVVAVGRRRTTTSDERDFEVEIARDGLRIEEATL